MAQNNYGLAWQVAFLAGCLYTIVGILKLGWLTNFLSHSVISGFMSGASVIIALSQVRVPLWNPHYSVHSHLMPVWSHLGYLQDHL